MARLLGIGDNVIDCNYTTGFAYPGGNCVNFAVFGRQLGNEAAYAGKIAADKWGIVIKNVLTEKGVDISRCVTEEGETGICGIRLTNGDRTITDENDAGLVKASPFAVTEEMLEYIEGFDVVHSSVYSYIEKELRKIRDTGVPVLYDFSDEWDEDMLRNVCPDITYAFFSGKNLPDEELEKYLRICVHECGCNLAVTTIGGRGALVYNGKNLFRKDPYYYEGEVEDTTGAGDSWITGFMTAYLEGKKRLDWLKENETDRFIREVDEEDYMENLIKYGMSMGNLLARKNCLIKGSFGYGTRFQNP
jgi:sugar/nucleoside kinase (ribokinase family)